MLEMLDRAARAMGVAFGLLGMAVKSTADALKVIFSSEEIESLPSGAREEKKVPFLRMLAKKERLPPPAVSVAPPRLSLLRWLLAPEKLPPPPPMPPPSERKSLLSQLIAVEKLPDPLPDTSGGAGKSFLGTLLSRETLPLDPVPEARTASRPSPGNHSPGEGREQSSGGNRG